MAKPTQVELLERISRQLDSPTPARPNFVCLQGDGHICIYLDQVSSFYLRAFQGRAEAILIVYSGTDETILRGVNAEGFLAAVGKEELLEMSVA